MVEASVDTFPFKEMPEWFAESFNQHISEATYVGYENAARKFWLEIHSHLQTAPRYVHQPECPDHGHQFIRTVGNPLDKAFVCEQCSPPRSFTDPRAFTCQTP